MNFFKSPLLLGLELLLHHDHVAKPGLIHDVFVTFDGALSEVGIVDSTIVPKVLPIMNIRHGDSHGNCTVGPRGDPAEF